MKIIDKMLERKYKLLLVKNYSMLDFRGFGGSEQWKSYW